MSPLSMPLLSDRQCAELLAAVAHRSPQRGRVFAGGPLGGAVVDVNQYDASEHHLNLLGDTAWLRGALLDSFGKCGQHFGMPRLELREMPRVLGYAIGGHFGWHVDAPRQPVGHGVPMRRLTVAIQLSEPTAYEGGGLEVEADNGVHLAARERGRAFVFPAWMRHRVTPVTQGCRSALVAWAY